MAIKFEINMTNKWLYSLIAIGVLLAFGFGVYAYQSNMRAGNPPVMGHSAGEIHVENSAGEIVSLQDALDDLASSSVKYKVGRYTGDGQKNRVISGIGFTPKSVIIFPLFASDGCDEWVIRTNDMSGTESPDTQGQQNQGILSLEGDGFKISNSCNVNSNTRTYSYIAWTW